MLISDLSNIMIIINILFNLYKIILHFTIYHKIMNYTDHIAII